MEMAHSGVHTASGTLVIFPRVDGLLRQRAASPCELSREALNALISTRVPIVLVSDSGAADMRQMQRELGLMQPFISRGGAALHIPPEYFTQLDDVAAPEPGPRDIVVRIEACGIES